MLTLVFIVSVYGLCAALVHAWHARSRLETKHFVMVTRNNEAQIEWAIRLLRMWSHFKGIHAQVTVVDAASIDDTLTIARKLRAWQPVEIVSVHDEAEARRFVESMGGHVKVHWLIGGVVQWDGLLPRT